MNAPIQPRWRQYIANVTAFLPGCDGEELRARCGLLVMRDQAMATKPACAEESYPLLEHVERTACNYAFQPMALHRLQRLRYELSKVVSAASGLELFARDLLTPDDLTPEHAAPGEGDDARA